MLRHSLIIVALAMAMVPSAMAQTSFFTDRALQQVNVLTSPTPLTAAIPYGPVRVCSLPLTQQSPCLPLATITDINGNAISNSIGGNFGQITTDATGRFTFGCTLGNNYQVQVSSSAASNTPAVNYPITCPGVGSNPQFTNLTVSGQLTGNCKTFETVACVDSANTAGWPGTTADAWIQAAINSAGNGKVFIASGSYAIGTANPAIVWKTGVRMECASNQSVSLNYTGTGVAFQFGNGTTGVQYGVMENCGITLGAAGSTAIQLKGNSAANNNPSSKNLLRKNFITGNGFANTTGIAVLDNSYVNRFEYDEIVNMQTPIKMGTANFSGESNVIWGDVIGCSGIASSIGINIAQTAGPVETYIIGGDVVGCATGISINTGNQGTAYIGGGMHMEQNATDIACVSTTTGGFIEGIDTSGTPAGAFTSVHGLTFAGCQNWVVSAYRQTGTYSADKLNLDATSSFNKFSGFDPNAAATVMAAGALNNFDTATNPPRFESIGGTFRSYRGPNFLTQYLELDGTGGQTRLNTGAGFSTVDFSINGTNAFEYSATALYPLTLTNTLGQAANPYGKLFLGTAATNNFVLIPAATAAARNVSMPDPLANVALGFSYNATNPVYQSKRGVAGCTTAASIGGTCATDITVTWGTAFGDANYSVTCTGSTPTAVPAAPFVVSGTKLAATVHINYFAITAVAASYATIDCIAVHD